MKKLGFLYLLIIMLFPAMAAAQDTPEDGEQDLDIESLVVEMNSRCPIDYGDEWVVTSVTMDADTAYIDILVPSQLKMFMSSLVGEGANVKRLWMNQLTAFDKCWRTMADKLAADNRFLVLLLRPGDDEDPAMVIIRPTDFAK